MSNSSSLPEVVGDVALTVDPYSVNEVYAAMKDLSENEDLRKELSEKGIEQSRKFSWEKAPGYFWIY